MSNTANDVPLAKPPESVKKQVGNRGLGRKEGSINKRTAFARAMLDEAAPDILREAIELAKSGDAATIKAILPYIAVKPPVSIKVDIGPLKTADDAANAYTHLAAQLKSGKIDADSMNAAEKIISGFIRAHEVVEIAERLRKIEDAIEAR